MAEHDCPGDGCGRCEREIDAREDRAEYSDADYDRLEAGAWWHEVPR